MVEWIVLAVLALVWWIPTFQALSDLQARDGLLRWLVWKWTAVICVPVVGPLLYRRRGTQQVALAQQPERNRPASRTVRDR